MSRRRHLFLAAALLVIGAVPVRADQPLLADLSSHLIAITTGFTGTSVVLFGATDGPGDVVAIVRGPEQDMVVREKQHRGGIWINTRSLSFASVPSYYAVFSTKPLAAIAPSGMRALDQIGIDNLRLEPVEANSAPGEVATFRAALLREEQRQGVYSEQPSSVSFLGDRLFRATISFPADVPTGTYFVEVLLVRDGNVVSGQTTPLVVSETGLNADLNEFATRDALVYGLAAVAVAALLGWLASLPFRDA